MSHVFFPYCLRSLILIVSSQNIEKAGDSQKQYDVEVFVSREKNRSTMINIKSQNLFWKFNKKKPSKF